MLSYDSDETSTRPKLRRVPTPRKALETAKAIDLEISATIDSQIVTPKEVGEKRRSKQRSLTAFGEKM
jgi:post-segregation antitoxin (ccd killing protein)